MASTVEKYEKKIKREKIQVTQNLKEPPSWSGRPWVGADSKSQTS